MNWFINYRIENNKYLTHKQSTDDTHLLLSLTSDKKIIRLVETILDENEFLSQAGIRALSKYYQNNPYSIRIADEDYSISMTPAIRPPICLVAIQTGVARYGCHLIIY